MVHRIQNRNPGYSDFSNMGPTPSFNFSTSASGPISHGANALKLENEVASETDDHQSVNENINQINNQYHEELLKVIRQKMLYKIIQMMRRFLPVKQLKNKKHQKMKITLSTI